MKNMLLIMQNLPHYREGFIKCLSQLTGLEIWARPCIAYDHLDPCSKEFDDRVQVREWTGIRLLSRVGFHVSFAEFFRILTYRGAVCIAWDPHFPLRHLAFWLRRLFNRQVTWWGCQLGRSHSRMLAAYRRIAINSSCGTLVYSEDAKERLIRQGVAPSKLRVFNNTLFSREDMRELPLQHKPYLTVGFIGRYQSRKKVERLLDLAKRLPFIRVFLAGPGMETLADKVGQLELAARVNLQSGHFPARPVQYEELEAVDLFVSPGHLGLMVLSAGCVGRPIIVDSSSDHAPEVAAAMEANQIFVDFSDERAVDSLFQDLAADRSRIRKLGHALFQVCHDRYHVDFMARQFYLANSDISQNEISLTSESDSQVS